MRQARLAHLRKMINLLQVHLIMTPVDDRFIAFDPEENSELAFSKMDSRNIDYAPLLRDGAFSGYVDIKDLAGVRGKTCRELAKEVTVKNKISPKARLGDVLKRLVDEPFLFVIKDKRLRGIITRADVNKHAFRTLFYIILSELESLLVDLIRIRLPCEKHLHLLSEERAKDVLYNYWRAKAGNVEISIEQYLSFSDIVNIILKSKDMEVWRVLGCTSKKQVKELSSLVDLRNRVMHSTRSLLDEENSIVRISRQYTKIWELIERLLENRDAIEDDIASVTFDRKNQDFRFVLKSGVVIRTPLSDIKGKELVHIGIEKLRKFLTSKDKTKKIDKTTLRHLKETIVWKILLNNSQHEKAR